MPINVDAPSWFSAIRADDKPVYLNSEGVLKTGRSLKGCLVSIAESLGIFKDYVTGYREREATHNRDAYTAAWRFVVNKYGIASRHHTEETMKERGYSRVDCYAGRLQGHDASDPKRAIVGRELRLILDTASGSNEVWWGAEVALQQYAGTAMQSDTEVATQSGTDVKEIIAALESSENADGLAESLRNLDTSAGSLAEDETRDRETAEENIRGVQVDEVRSKPVQIPRELGRAMVAGNKERLRQMIGSKTQIKNLAHELGYDPKAIASRRNYIQEKLEKRLESDPRAKSGKLTQNENRELIRAVFDKALGKNTMVAGIRGAMLGASNTVKRAQEEDNPGQVDVLELSKDKIKAVAHDSAYLTDLMVIRFGIHDQEISTARMKYIEQRAIKVATALVQKTKVELSSEQVDDVLADALRKSLEIGESRAWLGGALSKATRTVKPEQYGYKRSTEDVLEKAASERPQVLVEAADEPATALHETQRQAEQSEHTSSPPVAESITLSPQHHDLPEAAAVMAPSSSLSPVSLPKPKSYGDVDYFNQSDKGIIRLTIAVRNHQAAKQVMADDIYLAASVPEGYSSDKLSPVHYKYIKTTLLRHVAEHERTSPDTLLSAQDLHRMMKPITARALEMQSGRQLRAKVLYKNVAKHVGRKDAAFGDAMNKLCRDARSRAGAKVSMTSFVRDAAHKANIDIDMKKSAVPRAIRSEVRDMAEAYVNKNRKVLTDSIIEGFVQSALRQYTLADRMGVVPHEQQQPRSNWQGYTIAERLGLVR